MTLNTLYMMDAKGKVKEWSISVNEVEGTYTVTHGQQGGKMQTKTTVCKPKNIGKRNETTAAEQAYSEAKSKHTKQMDKGYVESIDKALVSKSYLPQLAHDYTKLKKDLPFELEPHYTSPKLDGVRCLADLDANGRVRLTSRGGKEYSVPKHLNDDVKAVLEIYGKGVVLDGELYIHGTELQDLVSAVKKHNGNTPKVKYCVYDLAGEFGETHTFEERLEALHKLANNYPSNQPSSVEYVPHVKVETDSDVWKQHDIHVANGYEGVIIRSSGKGSEYKHGYRSRALLKAKVMQDEEFLITGFTTDKDGCIVFIVQIDLEQTCKVNMKATKECKIAMAEHGKEYIGKLLKVQYQARTNSGNLQFPVGLQIREINGNDI